jgi:ubiquinone biosynthesis protein COQ4
VTAPTVDLPRIAPPPPRRKLDWRRARTALSTLIAEPERVEQVFELIEALEGDAGEKLFQRFLRHPNAPELLARRPSLLSVLSKRSELEALPEGSLGRAYARFMREGGIEADGLVEASQDTRAEHAGIDPERLWFSDRFRDMHDLWHALTGYGRDIAGEAALAAFTHAQTGNRGILSIVVASAVQGPWNFAWQRYLWRAWRRGRRAGVLVAAKWEELLAVPLAEVRRRLGVSAPDTSHPGGILVAEPMGAGSRFTTRPGAAGRPRR